MIPFTGGASEPSDTLFPGKAGGTVAVRRTLACTICRIIDPTQVPRPRQLRDASTVMRFRPAHQSMINRRFDDRASCPARKSPKQALACKPRIHSPASGNSGHESALDQTEGTGHRSSLARMAIGGFGPDEGFGAGIVLGEIGVDGGLQVGDRAEDAAADALPGHLGEEVLDGVEPGGRGRGEVEGPARMARQPGQHFGMLVGGIVVEHGVDRLAGRDLGARRR